jgi:hypothetical protein
MISTNMIEINLTEAQAEALQHAVDDHMMLCYEVIDHEGEDLPDYLSDVEMYCGCHVCETREHLMATFNWLRVNNIVDIAVV